MEIFSWEYILFIVETCLPGFAVGYLLGLILMKVHETLIYVFLFVFPIAQYFIYAGVIPDILYLQTLASMLFYPEFIEVTKVPESDVGYINVPYIVAILTGLNISGKKAGSDWEE